MSRAKIELRHDGERGALLLNGIDISNAVGPTLTVEVEPNAYPRVVTKLQGEVWLDITGVFQISDVTREALVSLGWTPPVEDES